MRNQKIEEKKKKQEVQEVKRKEKRHQRLEKLEVKRRRREAAALKREAETLYVESIMPIVGFDQALSTFIMEDGRLCDCVQITCKDQNSISEDEKMRDHQAWSHLQSIYPGDLSRIGYFYKADTSEQQAYTRYMLETAENPIHKELLLVQLDDLVTVSEEFYYREFVLFFYAKTASEYKENLVTIYSCLGRTDPPIITKMDVEKKIGLVWHLANKGA